MVKFSFQDLKIWQLAIQLAHELFDIADILEGQRLYRFAGQLRGSAMSMSNNIAEGSGSNSKKEFILFLNFAPIKDRPLPRPMPRPRPPKSLPNQLY